MMTETEREYNCTLTVYEDRFLTQDEGGIVVEAPKVVVSAGDQPGEMSKYTPYSAKGESYRLDPICGDIEDALQQSRAKKKNRQVGSS